ncbi:MAG: hypothetical protein LW817_01595 [Candidatus Caenarcaniphilales bacterium]|jgi:hypothetical protein|nr:hypothetical protein [Candidatus Caenarcaniphilales bacterium]
MKKIQKILFITLIGLLNIGPGFTSSNGQDEIIPAPRNLGINFRNPQHKLVVNGTTLIKGAVTIADGTQATGYILATDNNGVASWASAGSLSGLSEWTDAGTFLRPQDLSGEEDIVIGGTTTGAADILLDKSGAAIFNQQKNNADFRIVGQTVDNLFFTDASTNRIGINNASPAALLDIGNGTANFIDGVNDLIVGDDVEVDGTVFANKFNGGTFYGNGRHLTGIVGLTAAGSTGQIQFYNGGALGANWRLHWSKANYRLGLANPNPDTLLDINGATTYREMGEPLNPDEDAAVFWLSNSTGNGDDADFMAKVTEGGVTKVFTIIDFDKDPFNPEFNGMTLNGLTADRLVKTDSNKKLASVSEIRIDGTGNVGIGTSNPSSKLDVNGKTTTVNFKMTTGATTGYLLQSDATGNATWVNPTSITSNAAAGNNTEIQFNSSGAFAASPNLTWDGTRLYGLGISAGAGTVSSPSYSFAGDTDTGFYRPVANNFGFVVGGQEAIRINSSAQVGFGKLNPQATADVNGSLALKSSGIQTMFAATTLSPSKSIMKVASNSGAVNLSSNPQVSLTGIADGQLLIIKGTSNANTVRFNDGAGLSLKDNTFVVLGNKDTLVLMYDAGDNEWLEVMRSDK